MKAIFYSGLLTPEYARKGVLFDCIKQRFIDVLESYMWYFDVIETTDDFIDYFEYLFPSAYIRANPEKAKTVVYDLWHIANSTIIRYDLEPIYVYVMYHMIAEWCMELADRLKDGEDMSWLLPESLSQRKFPPQR